MAQAKKTTRPRRKAPTPNPPAVAPDALAPGGGRGLVSLGQLLDNMGQSVAQVIVAPRGLDVQVGDPVIYDAIDRSTPEKDAIVLAVGVSPDGSEARDLLKGAAAAGAAVVVFKLRDRSCDVIADAESAGVTLLSIPDQMSWSAFNRVLGDHNIALVVAAPSTDPEQQHGN